MSGRISVCVLAMLLMMVAGAAEPTRVVQAEEILKKIELGQPVEYDNVTVAGDLNLSGLNLTRVPVERTEEERNLWGLTDYEAIVVSPITIRNSVLLGTLNLKGTVLQDIADFGGTRVKGPAYLEGSKFSKTVDFQDIQFNQSSHFLGTQFNQNAIFEDATFNEFADFRGSQFSQTANFIEAKFDQGVYFLLANFSKTANFQGAQFNQGTTFQGAKFCQTANFQNTLFNDWVQFPLVSFNKAVNFRDAQFMGESGFWRTRFDQTADFQDAKFNESADFSKAQFNQTPNFSHTKNVQGFLTQAAQAVLQVGKMVSAKEVIKGIEQGECYYNNTIVLGDLDVAKMNLPAVPVKRGIWEFGLPDYENITNASIIITNSVIIGSVSLNGTAFENYIDFDGTIFEGPAFLFGSRFKEFANFDKARFNKTACFSDTKFNDTVSFDGVQFNQSAEFSQAKFNDTVSFDGVQFNQSAEFWQAKFKDIAYFRDAKFNQPSYFLEAEFEQESHFEDAGFFNPFFDNSQFSKEAFFGGAQINGTLSLYRTKYDVLNIRWSSIHDLAYDDTAYHLLIQNFNKLGFSDDARECHYSYRCKHREELFRQHKFDSWLFDLLAWATYGYGLRPMRPLGWAALFIFIGGIFFFLTGSVARSTETRAGKKPLALRKREEKPEGSVSIWEALLLGATYFTSGASSIISATPTEFVPIGRGRYVVVILRLLGWIFFVLFLSSLTRTV